MFLINWCFFLLMETEGSFMLNTWSPVLPLSTPCLSPPLPAVLGAQQTTVSAAAGGSGESAPIRCFPPETFACSGLGSCLIQINWLVFWPGLVWPGPVHILSSLPRNASSHWSPVAAGGEGWSCNDTCWTERHLSAGEILKLQFLIWINVRQNCKRFIFNQR